MPGYRSLDNHDALFWEDLHDFEVFDGHTSVTGLACHAHALEDTCGRRSRADRTGSAQAVVLTVCSLTHTAKTVALDNTLEAFTF